MKKQKIGVDIDGVLVNIIQPFLENYNAKYGTNHKYEQIKNYELTDLLKISLEDVVNEVYDFYMTETFRQLKPMNGAQESIDILSKENELIIVTDRPEKIIKITTDWLETYFQNKFFEIKMTNNYSMNTINKIKKSQLYEEKNCVIMIDDAPTHILDSAERGIQALLYDSPWNQNNSLHPNIHRVYNWKEIIEKINLLQQQH